MICGRKNNMATLKCIKRNGSIYIKIFCYITIRQLQTFYTRRFADVILVTQTQLTPIVTAKDEESAGLWNKKQAKAFLASMKGMFDKSEFHRKYS